MRKLGADELKEYHENGYVVIHDFFPKEELSLLNAEIDELEEKKDKLQQTDTGNEGYLYSLALLSETTQKFAQDERILTLIEDIVKPGIAIYSSKMASKLPHSDTVCHWHQDDAYYAEKSHSKTRMSTWIPLQDASENNGCLRVVPKSHKLGLQRFINQDNGSCRRALVEEEVDLSGAIPLEVHAGSIVLFSALLWHSSKGNLTDEARRAFIVSYQEATAQGGNGKQWVILRSA